MADFANLIGFIITGAVMFTAAYWMLRTLRRIAQFLRISEFVAAFILLAIGTSIPELIVGITAALSGSPELSLGNVIGANIMNLTLVIGIPILIAKGIKTKSPTIKEDTLYMFFIVMLPIILMIIGNKISRIDGVILIIAFILYIRRLLKQKSEFSKKFVDKISRVNVALSFLIFFTSMVAMILSAKYLIFFAENIAIDFALPQIFIGIFILSLGTTLPELITSTKAALDGEADITLGNIVGSVVANSALIIGIVALIHPIEANFLYFITSSIFMIIMAFLFLVFLDSRDELTWKEGMALIMLYIFFLIVELNIKGFLVLN